MYHTTPAGEVIGNGRYRNHDCRLLAAEFELSDLPYAAPRHRSRPYTQTGTTARTVLWERLCEQFDQQFVVVLDDVDQLKDEQALYQFYEHELITPILIANRKLDFFVGLDDRVESRLRGYSSIHFQTYTDEELVAILSNRADAALRPGAVSTLS